MIRILLTTMLGLALTAHGADQSWTMKAVMTPDTESDGWSILVEVFAPGDVRHRRYSLAVDAAALKHKPFRKEVAGADLTVALRAEQMLVTLVRRTSDGEMRLESVVKEGVADGASEASDGGFAVTRSEGRLTDK